MPKRRTLPYIILGLLAQHAEMTGRQITMQFKDEIGEFWKAAHSQIYPELKAMTDEGLIEKAEAGNDKEIYYAITESGRQSLRRWIEEPLTKIPISQDMFSLKLFFIQEKDDPEITRLVSEEIHLLSHQLAHLKEREAILFPDTEKTASYGHYLILKRSIARLESQLSWLESLHLA